MRLFINKIGTISVNKGHISLKAYREGRADFNVKPGSRAVLSLRDMELPCTLVSVNDQKGKKSLHIVFPGKREIMNELFYYAHKEVKCSLLIEEIVPLSLMEEVETLLVKLARRKGVSPGELLLRLTAFKTGVKGVDNLRFVSRKQMFLLKSKLQEELRGDNNNIVEGEDV